MMELYLHSHMRLHSIVLNELSTGTKLHFTDGYSSSGVGLQTEYFRFWPIINFSVTLATVPCCLPCNISYKSLKSERSRRHISQKVFMWRFPRSAFRRSTAFLLCFLPTEFNGFTLLIGRDIIQNELHGLSANQIRSRGYFTTIANSMNHLWNTYGSVWSEIRRVGVGATALTTRKALRELLKF
jgi:hypothetical protein